VLLLLRLLLRRLLLGRRRRRRLLPLRVPRVLEADVRLGEMQGDLGEI